MGNGSAVFGHQLPAVARPDGHHEAVEQERVCPHPAERRVVELEQRLALLATKVVAFQDRGGVLAESASDLLVHDNLPEQLVYLVAAHGAPPWSRAHAM